MAERLYSPKRIKEILNKYDFGFSKGLGQNFLIDGNIVRRISKSAGVSKDDYVIEIGPGFGTLSEELLLNAKKLVAIEIDSRLNPILKDTLSGFDNFVLLNEDAMKVDLQRVVNEYCDGNDVKVVANLPYYITTPIISRFIEEDLPVTSLTVMVQKEVADRMVAKPGSKEYGSLSLFVQFYSKASLAVKAPKSVFMPSPKVDSAVVHMEVRNYLCEYEEKNDVKISATKEFIFDLIHAAFNQRRKTILNSMTSNPKMGIEKERLKETLVELGIDERLRAEVLSIDQYIEIANSLFLNM